jgi:hypothetical protein
VRAKIFDDFNRPGLGIGSGQSHIDPLNLAILANFCANDKSEAVSLRLEGKWLMLNEL